MQFNLNFSTCPNDTFMFGALVTNKIDTRGHSFNLHLADIEELNSLALAHEPHITKISYGAYARVMANYQLLDSGSALGNGVGPLVVSKRTIYPNEVPFARVALPGEQTTAHLLFNMAFPGALHKKFYLFSEIVEAVLNDEVDVGVIIHESRFTYRAKGLKKVIDLGSYWEQKSGMPTPLGGIAVQRNLPDDVKLTVNQLLRDSIRYGFENPDDIMPFVRQYAQEMDPAVMLSHIKLYVNDFSLSLGAAGRRAVAELLNASGVVPANFDEHSFFVDESPASL
ncbi:MAG: 1,4-dihydroxy-6-naphthoate synthase [Bacteroidales bacterium]|nr:1,4-dihydroxy-6-naphthoate synthase [Bacteroidales bacterium]